MKAKKQLVGVLSLLLIFVMLFSACSAVDIEAGKHNPEMLVDVTAAKDMLGIRIEGDEIVIGAATTLTDISTNPIIKKYYPSLSKGSGVVGSHLIRNLGTLTGNVVTAQPAADAAMAVAPLDPTFVILF